MKLNSFYFSCFSSFPSHAPPNLTSNRLSIHTRSFFLSFSLNHSRAVSWRRYCRHHHYWAPFKDHSAAVTHRGEIMACMCTQTCSLLLVRVDSQSGIKPTQQHEGYTNKWEWSGNENTKRRLKRDRWLFCSYCSWSAAVHSPQTMYSNIFSNMIHRTKLMWLKPLSLQWENLRLWHPPVVVSQKINRNYYKYTNTHIHTTTATTTPA